MKMHEDEVPTDARLARRLVDSQFPRWKALPVRPLSTIGTDHAIFRLGEDLVLRLPRIGWASTQALKEREWLPFLANAVKPQLPLQRALGEPEFGYPFMWSICDWIPGKALSRGDSFDEPSVVADIVDLIRAFQGIPTEGGPEAEAHGLRGQSLKTRDGKTLESIDRLSQLLDANLLREIWAAALSAEEWKKPAAWFHGDLLPGNLIFEGSRLVGLIDFGGLGIGDPVCDLMIGWNLLSREGRRLLKDGLGVDECSWLRGLGQSLSQAAIYAPYYEKTNPIGAGKALRTLAEICRAWQHGVLQQMG